MSGESSLVIETSTSHASIALVRADGCVLERGFCSDRNHNAMLFEPLEELLREHGGRDIGLVLVGSGPGSYSGTRVGIAAAQGVAIALECPAAAVPSILAVPSAENGVRCLMIGDARRGSYWSAMMEHCRLTSATALCDGRGLEAVVARAVADGIPVVSFEESGRFPLPAELAGKIRLEVPDAARLWKVWSSADETTRCQWSAEIPQPLYLKPPHITPGKRTPLLRT